MKHVTHSQLAKRFKAAISGRLTRVIVIVALILLFAGVAVLTPTLGHDMALATTKQPERLTELYFNNHQQLPKQLQAGKPASFSFEIVNHEAQTKTYTYRVVIIENGASREVARQSLTLTDGAATSQQISISTPQPGVRLQTVVELLDMSQRIHFWGQS
jgi:uncharacterized membrane protein